MRLAAGCSILAFFLGACASTPGTPVAVRPNGSPTHAGTREPTVLPRTVITPGSETDVEQIFAGASEKARAGQPAEAAKGFDRVIELDPNGPLAPQALYESALSHEQAGDREGALQRFEQLARRFPSHALGREALVRSIRLLCFLERWQRAGEAADVLLSRFTDLNPFETVVGLSGKALARVAAGDLDGAIYNVEKGRTVVEEHGLDAAGAVPRDLAQLYFALGEVRRIRAEKIKFNPMPPNFPAVLEERCQLLLDAQSSYSDAMRAYDAHWSAMAGYRVGQLYQQLHRDVMAIPPTGKSDTLKKKQLFEGAMRLRYRVLLEKGLKMMEGTVRLGKRTGEDSAWVHRAEEARHDIELAIEDEKRALSKLLYTEAELQEALDLLRKKP